ncbi:MAG: 4a-hydroxytetrahydrobiopterin dehydratase [Chromatiales bacterium]|jgi:4a-hydroxytetrahydrobiopterin dehydratase|nr:4a-hydroxytetrahydrobiopterin dehydratase [Chromatiales bacterium]
MTETNPLTAKRCVPCEGGIPPLAPAAVAELRRSIHADWQLSGDGKWILREFRFPGYARTIGFVNALAWIAESEGHHPDLEVNYGRVLVKWSTHAVDGLTENDFICAAKVDQLVSDLG